MSKFAVGALAGIAATLSLQAALFFNADATAAGPASADAAAVTAAQSCSEEQEETNKKLVGAIDPTPDALYNMMHPDYVQHSPEAAKFAELNGVKGRPAMKLLREAFDRLGVRYGAPPIAPDRPRDDLRYKMIAECDMVMVLRQQWLPDPQTAGKFYAAYGFELWRIKDGKLHEHWDDARIRTPVPEYLQTPVKDLKPGNAAAG